MQADGVCFLWVESVHSLTVLSSLLFCHTSAAETAAAQCSVLAATSLQTSQSHSLHHITVLSFESVFNGFTVILLAPDFQVISKRRVSGQSSLLSMFSAVCSALSSLLDVSTSFLVLQAFSSASSSLIFWIGVVTQHRFQCDSVLFQKGKGYAFFISVCMESESESALQDIIILY